MSSEKEAAWGERASVGKSMTFLEGLFMERMEERYICAYNRIEKQDYDEECDQ